MEDQNMTYKKWDKELNKLQEGTGKYEWDEPVSYTHLTLPTKA